MNTQLASESKPITAWELWRNPIFLRYCKSRLRVGGWIFVFIVFLFAGFIFGMIRAGRIHAAHTYSPDLERIMINPLLVLVGIVLFAIGTGQVAGGMTSEADEGGVDYQRLTPLTPMAKVVGYWLGLPIREIVSGLTVLPFFLWSAIRGQVPLAVWIPLLVVFTSTTLLYYMTGLVAGSVLKNRRWAFLVSIGLVVLLYTVLPTLSGMGLVFLKYLTVTPSYAEAARHLIPHHFGETLGRLQDMAFPSVRFFNLDFNQWVFTLFTQGGLMLTLGMMVFRRWRQSEAHLLGKRAALGLFAWIHILLIGNALPLIETGGLFPSKQNFGFIMTLALDRPGGPRHGEAMAMSCVYGTVTLLCIIAITLSITPTADTHRRGLRRCQKLGWSRIPMFADAAGAQWFIVGLCLIGAAGWYWFTRSVVQSVWFPGQLAPLSLAPIFAGVLLVCSLGFHALLEAWGGRRAFMAVLFGGIIPLMVGGIFGMADILDGILATWICGISPLAAPTYAVASQLPLSDIPAQLEPAFHMAFWFWQGIAVLFLIRVLMSHRQELAARHRFGQPVA
jgi:hypothetical protein